MAKKDSFVFYKSFYDAIKQIPEEYQLELYNAILQYSLEGLEPNNLSNIASAMFTLIKPNIDSSQKKYEASVSNGKKGGRPKKETQEKPNLNPEETQEKANDNLNDNDNVNDNKKENIKKKYGDNGNVKFTDEELKKVKEYFPKDYTERIQILDDYIQSTGKKYKDFFATLRNWARKDGYKPPEKKEEIKQEEFITIDTSQLTAEEYGKYVRGKLSTKELIKKGKINV